MSKFEQDIQKKLLNGCRSTFEFFLLMHIDILFWSIDTIFGNLTKNALKFFKLEKRFQINFFSCPKYDFWKKKQFKLFFYK